MSETPHTVWLNAVNGLVVSARGIRARGRPGFDSGVVPLFHWVATLGKLFGHIDSLVKREFSAPKWLCALD